jgi:hypothetical protein
MLLRDENNNIVFDTLNYYIKTDPNGVYKAGGYIKPVIIYGLGAGSFYDHGNGGFGYQILSGSLPNNSSALSITVYIPQCTNLTYFKSTTLAAETPENTQIINNTLVFNYGARKYRSNFYQLIFNEYTSAGFGASTIPVVLCLYRWVASQYDDGVWRIYPEFFNSATQQQITNLGPISASGYLTMSVTRAEAALWNALPLYNDYNLLIYNDAYHTFTNYALPQINDYGVTEYTNILLHDAIFLSDKTPDSIGLATTP